MNDINVDSVLSQMRSILAEGRVDLPAVNLESGVEGAGAAETVGRSGFSTLLAESINGVNSNQKASAALQDRYLQGDETVSLAQVMVAGQKSEISFQSLLQVRNRVVSAYEEIMRMPI